MKVEFAKVRRPLRSRISAGREMVTFFLKRPNWGEAISNELPFGSVATAAYLEKLEDASAYLEFGSGSSTIVASDSHVERIVSVESDVNFLRAVSLRIENSGRISPRIDLSYADIGKTGPWGVPLLKAKAWGAGTGGQSIPQLRGTGLGPNLPQT